jgi:translation initiation factor 2 beta subunit (eIF-2beta)/eIF-5
MKSATIQERYLTVIEEFIVCPYCKREITQHPLPKIQVKCWWCKKFFKVKPNPEDVWDNTKKATK